jgi:hypothetical protein
MKEKLIEIMNSVPTNGGHCVTTADLAEHLIQNGVVVLPCKVGDVVYRIMTSPHTKIKSIKETKVCRIAVDADGIYLFCQHCAAAKSVLGKNVFLSREEAERALKGK